MDTGATHHVTPDLTNMTSTNPIAGPDKLFVGNGTGLSNSNIGNSVISCSLRPLHLKNVLHVPRITTNLTSVQKLCSDNNVTVEFNVGGFIVKDLNTRRDLLRGKLDRGLYKLCPANSANGTDSRATGGMNFSLTAASSVSCNKASASGLWHTRLGHPASTVVNRVLTSCNLPTKLSVGVCDTSLMAKSHRLPFSLSSFRALQTLNLVHSDLWGSAPEIGINGARYFVLFVDDHTRFSWIYYFSPKMKLYLLSFSSNLWLRISLITN